MYNVDNPDTVSTRSQLCNSKLHSLYTVGFRMMKEEIWYDVCENTLRNKATVLNLKCLFWVYHGVIICVNMETICSSTQRGIIKGEIIHNLSVDI